MGRRRRLLLIAWGWVPPRWKASLAASYQNSTLVLWLRIFAPFAILHLRGSPGRVETWRGSPMAFLAWQLCLCALAVIVALLRGADPGLRTRLLRLLAGVLVLAGLMYALAVVGGWAYPVISTPGAAPVPIAG